MSELSSLSVTVQERDFKMRPVSPNPQSVAGSLDMLFEEGKGNEIAVTLYIMRRVLIFLLKTSQSSSS